LRNKADAAQSGSLSEEERREALSEIIADSDQLIKTFNALLMISRVEAGSQVTELAELDMSALMLDVAELYEPLAEEAGVGLTVNVKDGLKVQGSRELLSQAMANLLDNAFKYGLPEGGAPPSITITLSQSKNQVIASIADCGPGIPPEARDKVRERFARLDESRSKPGNGLGLSLVEAIASLHGGTLELGDADPGLIASLILPKS